MSQYFPPYRSSRGDIKVELDWSNYVTKTDPKNVTHVDVSSFTSKTNLDASKIETKIEGKIPSIKGFATNSTLTAVENKIPDVSSL